MIAQDRDVEVLKLAAWMLARRVCPDSPALVLNAVISEAASELDQRSNPSNEIHLVTYGLVSTSATD